MVIVVGSISYLGLYLLASVIASLHIRQINLRHKIIAGELKKAHCIYLDYGAGLSIIAQKTLRHKSKKMSSKHILATIIINCFALGWLLTKAALYFK